MKLSNHNKIIIYVYYVLIILLGSGCGVWENFTTYFNLYYNTQDLFEKSEEQIKAQKKELFSTEIPSIPGAVNTNLIKVIEKCSNILQFNSESAYVEDALLMLGKSFYYQRNYQKALRKFNELKEGYAESDLLLEADLWIAKCEMRLRNYNEALTILSDVKKEAVEREDENIIREAYVEEISYWFSIEDYENAIATANEFMNVSEDDEIKARVWFEIGKLNLKINDVSNAIVAFENVFDYSPDFDLEFEAKLSYGVALRDDGRNEDALNVFNQMRREDKYKTDFAKIDFEIAKTNRSLGKIDEAVDLFSEVDTLYKNTPTSAAAKYELGQIYEYEYFKFDSAATYYKKASLSSLPQEYIQQAKEKNALFTRYSNLSKDVSGYGKQLFYLENPEEFVKDSVAYVEDSLAIAEEISNIKELQEIWAGLDSLINRQDTTGYFADSVRAIDSLIVADSTLIKDSLLVWIKNPKPEDSLFVASLDSLFNTDLFFRSTARYKQQLFDTRNRQSQLANQLPDSLKFKNNPPQRPAIQEDSLRTILAKSELQLGNLFLTELDFPDSSKWYYNNILQNYPDTRYQANTLYALGSYYLTVENKHLADSLFNIIYENYQSQSIVNAAADKLNKPLIDLNYNPASNDYEDAEYVMLNEDYDDAVVGFYDVYYNYPESPFAAKALYAAAWILENELLLPDSAVSVYDTLVSKYPASIYVRDIAGKLSMYKQDKRNKQLAIEDSIKSLTVVTTDSLASDSLHKPVITEIEKSDTTTVVSLGENKILEKERETGEEQVKTLPRIKEPLWNPRRKK